MEYPNITKEQAKNEVGKGWHDLIDLLYEKLPKGAIVKQVKEKFGGLRFYTNSDDEDFQNFRYKIEEESLIICEVCGKPGKLTGKNWGKTLCDKHSKEYKN